jgi:hypothetical protein
VAEEIPLILRLRPNPAPICIVQTMNKSCELLLDNSFLFSTSTWHPHIYG